MNTNNPESLKNSLDAHDALSSLGSKISIIDKLRKISRSISKLDCASCNYELSKRQETRRKNLLNRAKELAKLLKLQIYHQSDPRGVALYLVTEDMDHTNYNHGIALR